MDIENGLKPITVYNAPGSEFLFNLQGCDIKSFTAGIVLQGSFNDVVFRWLTSDPHRQIDLHHIWPGINYCKIHKRHVLFNV